ncbi:MAG: hypothetical protein DI537_42575 [Stutzerimonas stutzeri]|nr:MAG: hypothetical protein DI537_42575 [Stutzerimonas stutzeri]
MTEDAAWKLTFGFDLTGQPNSTFVALHRGNPMIWVFEALAGGNIASHSFTGGGSIPATQPKNVADTRSVLRVVHLGERRCQPVELLL